MKFGTVAIDEALGGTAVHSIRKGGLVLKKGTRIGPDEVEALRREGIEAIVVARLEAGDVSEDDAAAALADRLAGQGIRVEHAFTGRANLYAEVAGVLTLDKVRIDALNAVDESITFATLPAYAAVEPGEMVATVKIIPFAVAGETLSRALASVEAPFLSVAPFRPMRVAVLSTLLPGLKDSTVAKTLRVLEGRLAPAGARIIRERRVPHDAEALRSALEETKGDGADLIVVFGASAIADRRDVIPAAIEAASGQVDHLGMPVDPGNLLLIGRLGGKPVLGAPGCARSPKENGFDWVLNRLLAGLPVSRQDITSLGVGGLLMEIVTRPQPREAATPETEGAQRVAAVVLAAGRSTRMGGPNKLVEEIDGRPLVRYAVEAALASRASPVIVVTGHQAGEVMAALAGLDVRFVHNPRFADGLSTSVAAGIAALGPDVDAAAILLGDMPGIDGALIRRLAAALDPARGAHIIVPTIGGERGNPLLFARRFFDALRHLEGDAGARQILKAHAEAIVEVPIDSEAVRLDVDTPEALAAVRLDHTQFTAERNAT
jgi:molybdenum cofactor cytidylyltransferase